MKLNLKKKLGPKDQVGKPLHLRNSKILYYVVISKELLFKLDSQDANITDYVLDAHIPCVRFPCGFPLALIGTRKPRYYGCRYNSNDPEYSNGNMSNLNNVRKFKIVLLEHRQESLKMQLKIHGILNQIRLFVYITLRI